MRKIFTLAAVVLFVSFSKAQNNNNWKLIFEDNFDGTTFNAEIWQYSKWYELFVPELVEVKDGNLIMTSKYGADGKIHGGGINTRGKIDFLYGKVETRARLKVGKGAFSAIWMMPEDDSDGWPVCGEIDIMEQVNNESAVYQTIHTNFWTNLGINNPPHNGHPSAKVDEFNIYGLEWFPDRLDFTLNGKITFTYPRILTDKSGQWPFDKEFYIKLEQKAGEKPGGWAAVPDKDAVFTMEVDWIRVYQSDSSSSYTIPKWMGSSAFDSGHWKDQYVKTITSSGALNNVDYIATELPESHSVLYPDTLILTPNTKFSLHLTANSLGAYTESTILQDLRYTHCTAFADFDGDKVFETVLPTIGISPPTNAKGGNIDVMNVTHTFDIPDKTVNEARIRVVYRGAWVNKISPELDLNEGIVYDFNVKIKASPSSLSDMAFTPKVELKGNTVLITGLDGKNTVSLLDFTGKIISHTHSTSQQMSLKIPFGFSVLNVQNELGQMYSKKLLGLN